MEKIQHLCAKAGVAVVVAPTPPGCSAKGLAKWLNPEKAFILLNDGPKATTRGG